MASKTVLRVNIRDLRRVRKKLTSLIAPLDGATRSSIGKTVVRDMKGLISKGVSPIQGRRRFKKYRGSYERRIRKRQLGDKRLRPVNLKLSGDFLKSLAFRLIPNGAQVYFRRSVDPDAEDKERGHREGANRQERRPIIPDAPRENFAVKIQERILDILDKRVKTLIK